MVKFTMACSLDAESMANKRFQLAVRRRRSILLSAQTAGHRIVYLAESPAGALVESLVHTELNERSWPRFYDLMQIAAPDDIDPPETHANGNYPEPCHRASHNLWLVMQNFRAG